MKFNLLNVGGLTIGYRRGVPVLHSVDLDVNEHEVVCILGSNGAGKSTLIRTIAGLLMPWQGTITFAGEDITGLMAHDVVTRGLVCVPSGRRVFSELSVIDNLRVGAHVYARDRRRVERNVKLTLERFEVLGTKASMSASQLSGGEQQLLSIARGLMSRPKLIMLDEPSMGLDPKGVAAVFETVKSLRDEGTTVLMIEKLANLAIDLADRLFVMELGNVVLHGDTDRISQDPRIKQAYLGS